MPPTKRSSSKKAAQRSSSVDSGGAKRSAKKGDSDGSSAGDKRKARKSASFAADLPDNQGKTVSTRKSAKAAKSKESKESYAKKASSEEKTSWIYETIISFSMKVGKCPNTCAEVYSRHKLALQVLQSCDPSCAVADHMNGKRKPIRSPGEFPKDGEHGRYQRHFTIWMAN